MGIQYSKKSRRTTSTYSGSSGGGEDATSQLPEFNEITKKMEITRQQRQHYLFKYAFQTSFFAPVEELLKQKTTQVLEIKHGFNPCWMNDIANDFPNCKLYGIDVVDPCCPLQPNCSTLKTNIYSHFPFRDNSMDYTHQRMLFVSCPSEAVDTIFKEVLRVTKPNCWIEMMEPDLVPRSAGPLFTRVMTEAKEVYQHQLNGAALTGSLKQKFQEIGLEKISTDYTSLPLCWGGFIGKLLYEDMLALLRQIGPIMAVRLGITGDDHKAQYEKYIDRAFDECVEYSTYIDIHWTIGRKPGNTRTWGDAL